MDLPIDQGLVQLALDNGYTMLELYGKTEKQLRRELRSKGLLHEDDSSRKEKTSPKEE